MVRFMKEYRVSKDFVGDFERAYAATGVFGAMFVDHGCESYALIKDTREPERYLVTHSWSDDQAFRRAQEGAAQRSYDFQQRSRGWVLRVDSLSDAAAESVMENSENQYVVLSET